MTNALGLDYFERIYRASDDPWGFETSWYEQRKYALTLAALPQPRYGRAFEPGCSIGVLTEQLAARCDRLLSMDLVPAVAARTGGRLASQAHVEVRSGSIPRDWPRSEAFDLILLSEVAYYQDQVGLEALIACVRDTLAPGGDLVAVHYTGETDYPLSGAQVHDCLLAVPWLACLGRYTEEAFSLLVLRR